MQGARHPVQLPTPSNDPESRIQGKRNKGRRDDQPGGSGKSSQTSQTTTSQTRTSTSSRTSLAQTLTTTQNQPAPTSFITIASPETITPGTITISATQATTQAITQTVFNPTTVLSSSPLPSKATANKPSFLFNSPNNATVCGSLNLTWLYSGQSVIAMTLVVQDQVGLSVSGSTNAQPTSSITFRTLTTDVPSDADSYLWAPVDIDEGWYTAKAFDTGEILGISAQSTPFFVSQNQLHSPCPTANTTTSSTNPTDTPAHSSGRPALHVGDIVGIALGSTAGVALLVLAFLFPRFWRKELPDPKTRRPYLLY